MKRHTLLLIWWFSIMSSFLGGIGFHAKADSEAQLKLIVEGFNSDGDCAILRYGDIQILIDSAENKEAFTQICEHMQANMAGDSRLVWDYVIFTHPDADHIGNAADIIEYIYGAGWEIGVIVDYGKSDKGTLIAQNYEKKVETICVNHDVMYFNANSLSETDRVKEFRLSEKCKLSILYNGACSSGKSNDLSVCCLIEIGEQKLLFTGDLEIFGEKSLIQNHAELLSGVTFFKAGHHGSDTSNTEEFIDLIRPAYVSVTLEKNTTGQDFSLNHFLKYTDYIYPAYVEYLGEYYEMFGTTSYLFDGKSTIVTTEGNAELQGENKNIRNATIPFADSSEYVWYEAQLKVSEDLADEVSVYTFDEGKTSYSNCTLVKYGHYDILIDCGSTVTDSVAFVEKLKRYVVDGKIEYVIVSHYHVANISQLVGNYKKRVSQNDGVLDVFDVGKIIDGELTNLEDSCDSGFYKKYLNKANRNRNRKTLSAFECFEENIASYGLKIKVVGNNGKLSMDENDYSLATFIYFNGEKMLFVGDMTDYSTLMQNYLSDIKKVSFLRISGSASCFDESYNEFAEIVYPKYSVIGSALRYTMPNGKVFMGNKEQMALLKMFKSIDQSHIYFTGYINEKNEYIPVNGDLIYRIGFKNKSTYYQMKSSSKSIPICIDDNF